MMAKRAGKKVMCLRRTNSGHPEHPLYLPNGLTPIRYKERI
jgi:hypothetical protein